MEHCSSAKRNKATTTITSTSLYGHWPRKKSLHNQSAHWLTKERHNRKRANLSCLRTAQFVRGLVVAHPNLAVIPIFEWNPSFWPCNITDGDFVFGNITECFILGFEMIFREDYKSLDFVSGLISSLNIISNPAIETFLMFPHPSVTIYIMVFLSLMNFIN